jgi:hypothetical protein
MKATELIAQLSEMIEEYGDREVRASGTVMFFDVVNVDLSEDDLESEKEGLCQYCGFDKTDHAPRATFVCTEWRPKAFFTLTLK